MSETHTPSRSAPVIETFETTELNTAGEVDCSAEQIALFEQLGLDGQKSLVGGEGDLKTDVFPYKAMSAEEEAVYSMICDQRTEISLYDREPIPLRVLQVAAHAKENCERLEIWHPKDAHEKDPILVAVREHPERSWEKTRFILARWGEVLEPIEVLAKRAGEKLRSKKLAALLSIKGRVDMSLRILEDPNVAPEVILSGGTRIPRISDLD